MFTHEHEVFADPSPPTELAKRAHLRAARDRLCQSMDRFGSGVRTHKVEVVYKASRHRKRAVGIVYPGQRAYNLLNEDRQQRVAGLTVEKRRNHCPQAARSHGLGQGRRVL